MLHACEKVFQLSVCILLCVGAVGVVVVLLLLLLLLLNGGGRGGVGVKV